MIKWKSFGQRFRMNFKQLNFLPSECETMNLASCSSIFALFFLGLAILITGFKTLLISLQYAIASKYDPTPRDAKQAIFMNMQANTMYCRPNAIRYPTGLFISNGNL